LFDYAWNAPGGFRSGSKCHSASSRGHGARASDSGRDPHRASANHQSEPRCPIPGGRRGNAYASTRPRGCTRYRPMRWLLRSQAPPRPRWLRLPISRVSSFARSLSLRRPPSGRKLRLPDGGSSGNGGAPPRTRRIHRRSLPTPASASAKPLAPLHSS